MKKNLNVRKAQSLRLSRETLLSLEKDGPRVWGGTQAELDPAAVPSVKFCTELGCTTSG